MCACLCASIVCCDRGRKEWTEKDESDNHPPSTHLPVSALFPPCPCLYINMKLIFYILDLFKLSYRKKNKKTFSYEVVCDVELCPRGVGKTQKWLSVLTISKHREPFLCFSAYRISCAVYLSWFGSIMALLHNLAAMQSLVLGLML